MRWKAKDPAEVLDYPYDWTKRLAGDSIASVAWTVPDGLTKASETQVGAVTTIWLSGGTAATQYTLSCVITTTAGRTYKQSFKLRVRSR